MKKRILHVSDFHIGDPKDRSATEHLRELFYQEYLSDLPDAFARVDCEGSIDAIIATGDFVDCGRLENFSHAKKVLEYLAQSWKVPSNRVVVCIGNHDIDRSREENSEEEAARFSYIEFCNAFANSAAEQVGNSAAVAGWLEHEKLAFLALDSTRSGLDRPGRLDGGETDDIINWVRGVRDLGAFTIVCSHFPVDMGSSSLSPFDDPGGDWYNRHIWESAAKLRERLVKISSRPTLWLSGDIHRDSLLKDGQIAFCTTGRLGVTSRRHHGEIRRQVAVVELSDDSEFRIWRAEYEGLSQQDAHTGQWIAREANWTRLDRPRIVVPSLERVVQPQPSNKLILIDPPYEVALIRQIAEDGLYKVGRFETTTQGQVSLSWVNVESLCALDGHMEPIARRMADWISHRVIEEERLLEREVLLVGMDCWGSILAGQISVKLGVPFLPIATRAEGRFSCAGEQMDDLFLRKLANCRAAVLVTDIVGTGRSLAWVKEKAEEALGEDGSTPEWFAASIMCDHKQERGTALDFLKAHGSICVNLRMPLFPAEALPPRDVFPPEFTLY